MEKKAKNGKVTIANIIAIVGVVLLMVFTFIGHSFMSGGELGMDIVVSVAITAFIAFLVWFMIKAKGAENELAKWKKLEIATLVVYVVVAIPLSLYGGIMQFFIVNDNKERVKECAKDDLDRIDQMFLDYKEFEEQAIGRTSDGLSNAIKEGRRNDDLKEFMKTNHISVSEEGVSAFKDLQMRLLVGSGYERLYTSFKEQRVKIEQSIDSWSMMQIPTKAKQIPALAESAQQELNTLSNGAKLSVINNESGLYKIKEYQVKRFETAPLELKEAMQGTGGFSVKALLFVLLIHILILFNYVVAYRTSTLSINKRGRNDNGRILK